MHKFVAMKPVRFDRNYAVGEVISGEVINPRNVKRLIDWGKIQQITESKPEPESGNGEQPAAEAQETPTGGEAEAGDPNIQPEQKTPQDGAESVADAVTFTCSVCGRICASKAALTSHMKTHG